MDGGLESFHGNRTQLFLAVVPSQLNTPFDASVLLPIESMPKTAADADAVNT
jgi:hypothetical protein